MNPHLLDLTLPSPAENLACDEALLNTRPRHGGEVLRFWEAREAFVVVGYANRAAAEVDLAACAAASIPVFRRCSGGGTVLQGRGCLNYSLILRITDDGPLRTITAANHFIMERNRRAIATLFPPEIGGRTPEISVRGHTDLVRDGRKFSGNAQRRQKDFLLFHGTFLLEFDLPLVARYLRMPSLQPGYRAGRSHDDFLVNLNVPAAGVKAALQRAWNATEASPDFPGQECQKLAEGRYASREWNLRL